MIFGFDVFHRSPSTICGTTIIGHPTATALSFPKFDQYHIVLATVKLLQLNTATSTVPPDRVSVALINQKHVYNGIVFKLFEIYSIENHSLKLLRNNKRNNYNDKQIVSKRNKSLSEMIKASFTDENKPFLNR